MDCVLTVAILLFILLISSGIREMYKKTPGKKYKGNAKLRVRLNDDQGHEECKTECNASSNCHGFVHNTDLNRCTMIHGEITENDIRDSNDKNTLYEKGKTNDFEEVFGPIMSGGATIPDKQINTRRVCRKECKKDPNCGGFKFNKKTKVCIFKEKVKQDRDKSVVTEKKVSA